MNLQYESEVSPYNMNPHNVNLQMNLHMNRICIHINGAGVQDFINFHNFKTSEELHFELISRIAIGRTSQLVCRTADRYQAQMASQSHRRAITEPSQSVD